MGRKPKTGIEYAGWDVDVFEDRKIQDLLDGCGVAGFTVYFALCQRAYATSGYYLRWEARDAIIIKHDLRDKVDEKTVRAAVDLCLDLGLFDAELYLQYGVLTSRSIQSRYALVLPKRSRKEVVAEWWLLSPAESKDARPMPLNG